MRNSHYYFPVFLTTIIILLVTPGCNDTSSRDESKLSNIAKIYLEENHAEWLSDKEYIIEIIDHDKQWEVRWKPSKGIMGGGPAVMIDKKTMKRSVPYIISRIKC